MASMPHSDIEGGGFGGVAVPLAHFAAVHGLE